MLNFLDRAHSIAPRNYSRWLVPPAALAIHLCIGQVYALSVFKIPMTQLIGITAPIKDQDWTQGQLAWIFSVAIFVLGFSAAIFGRWVERNGPRKAMFVAACCFGGGFLVAALGVAIHNLWIVYLGYGVLGGIGLGIGYISPVSTLVRWFPDRPGMATGLAIMGFGGGGMIGSPLAVDLMNFYASSTSAGVAPTLVTMGIIYFCFMLFGVFILRVPPIGWLPDGYAPPLTSSGLVTTANVTAHEAPKTRQFWLLWVILCVNITAGIGILEQASPMIQDIFLTPKAMATIDPGNVAMVAVAAKRTALIAGGFVGLLSLFNMLGRFFWSSLSDFTGRKTVYFIYLLLGPVLYFLIPVAGHMQSTPFFVCLCLVILSMYGGGFATVPAYLSDLFGTLEVGAIHGRLITAWSIAGVLGPQLVHGIREYQLAHHASPVDIYAPTMYLMCGLLLIGAVCNFLIRPVDPHHHAADSISASGAAGTHIGRTS